MVEPRSRVWLWPCLLCLLSRLDPGTARGLPLPDNSLPAEGAGRGAGEPPRAERTGYQEDARGVFSPSFPRSLPASPPPLRGRSSSAAALEADSATNFPPGGAGRPATPGRGRGAAGVSPESTTAEEREALRPWEGDEYPDDYEYDHPEDRDVGEATPPAEAQGTAVGGRMTRLPEEGGGAVAEPGLLLGDAELVSDYELDALLPSSGVPGAEALLRDEPSLRSRGAEDDLDYSYYWDDAASFQGDEAPAALTPVLPTAAPALSGVSAPLDISEEKGGMEASGESAEKMQAAGLVASLRRRSGKKCAKKLLNSATLTLAPPISPSNGPDAIDHWPPQRDTTHMLTLAAASTPPVSPSLVPSTPNHNPTILPTSTPLKPEFEQQPELGPPPIISREMPTYEKLVEMETMPLEREHWMVEVEESLREEAISTPNITLIINPSLPGQGDDHNATGPAVTLASTPSSLHHRPAPPRILPEPQSMDGVMYVSQLREAEVEKDGGSERARGYMAVQPSGEVSEEVAHSKASGVAGGVMRPSEGGSQLVSDSSLDVSHWRDGVGEANPAYYPALEPVPESMEGEGRKLGAAKVMERRPKLQQHPSQGMREERRGGRRGPSRPARPKHQPTHRAQRPWLPKKSLASQFKPPFPDSVPPVGAGSLPTERCPVVVLPESSPDPPVKGCNISVALQLPCGGPDISPTHCLTRRCCVDRTTGGCYFPLETCTRDGRAVFLVRWDDVVPAVDPRSLVAGPRGCSPAKVTSSFALFHINMKDCGANVTLSGQTRTYSLSVRSKTLVTSRARYGLISRDQPYSSEVQCSHHHGSLSSAAFLVKDLPPPKAVATGSLRVQLRVATDCSYSAYYPQSALPLRLSLKSPLYMEVHLVAPPEPSLVLLVHYCLAYPPSAQAAWVLLYDGCPNDLDPSAVQPLAQAWDRPQFYKRFKVETFQFINPDTGAYLQEQMYIMCSTEVCSPSMKSCDAKCFNPQRSRIAVPGSKLLPGDIAVHQGPFLMPVGTPPQ
ncbi:uncharacterized protein LOC136751627 [Amia ocellicauda]|uniref:uncharacterized protein LOC136751627 n=1 Tax=Amia ocellicauda TaxID=2972642 RepID=UPI003464E17A